MPKGVVEPDPLNPDRTITSYRGARPLESPRHEGDSYDLIVEHIEQHLGPVATILHEKESYFVHIDVIPVAPTEALPFWTFVTSGMSDEPMPVPREVGASRYAELVICLPPGWPVPGSGYWGRSVWEQEENYWPIGLLKLLALFPHQFETWFTYGHTVAYAGAPNTGAEGVGFTDALLMPPTILPEGFWSLEVARNKTIEFLQVVPLYPDEAEFKRRHDWQALYKLAGEEQEFELVDPARPSLVSG
jgi:hypothetical protein